MVGKDHYVINAKYTLDVYMEHVQYHGSAIVKIAGEAFFVIEVCINGFI